MRESGFWHQGYFCLWNSESENFFFFWNKRYTGLLTPEYSSRSLEYHYHHNLLPSSFRDLFLSSYPVHQYETRLASQYRPHFCRTNIKQFSILYRGPKIWNSLPVSLISSPSIFVFKKKLKNYLTDSRSVV